jgi:outer membrane protein assembly factor BamB/predicted phosphodiesterase
MLLSALSAAQTHFNFAHISDTHIGSATGAEDLRRTVADLNGSDSIAFAVISGDITEYGSDDQLRLAKQILDSLSVPWYIVPGNHDMKWSESGGASFATVFGAERFMFEHGKYLIVGMHQGPRMRMGDGYWAAEDITWFDSIRNTMKDPRQRLIFVTHYPADSGIANWYAMTERLRQMNTQVILNGHWHRNFSAEFEGIPSIVGRSNLRANAEVGGYNIISVRGDSLFASVRIPGVGTKLPWTSIGLAERDFSGRPHSQVPRSDYGAATVRWKQSSHSSMTSGPAIWKEYIASGYSDGTVIVRSIQTGKEKMRFTAGAGVYTTPAMQSDHLVFTSADSSIHCYSLKTQTLQWTFKTKASIVANPLIDHGIVYTGASDKVFRALELRSGTLLWHFDSLAGFVEARPTIAEGRIYIGAWDEHLYCLNAKDGSLVWKWKGNKRGTLLSPAVCEPVVANGKVFIVAPDRFMTVLDAATGKELWRTNQFQVRETIGASEDGERVYLRTMNDSLYALSTRSAVPEVVWSVNAGFGYDINSSQIREKGGIVWFTTMKGILFAVDAKSGRIVHSFKEDNIIAHTPVPLSPERVIFSNINGTIMDLFWKGK